MLLSKLYSAARIAVIELRFPSRWMSRRLARGLQGPRLLVPTRCPMLRAPARKFFGLVPANQYENNIRPKKFQLGSVVSDHWEIIPLLVVIAFDIIVVTGIAFYMAINHKVDVQFTDHNWNCISRTMDLHKPTIHKLVVLYQKYEPWPEMQYVLDKMTEAEHRLRTRQNSCKYP